MERLAVYEAPFIVDGTRPANDLHLPERVRVMVEEGRRGGGQDVHADRRAGTGHRAHAADARVEAAIAVAHLAS